MASCFLCKNKAEDGYVCINREGRILNSPKYLMSSGQILFDIMPPAEHKRIRRFLSGAQEEITLPVCDAQDKLRYVTFERISFCMNNNILSKITVHDEADMLHGVLHDIRMPLQIASYHLDKLTAQATPEDIATARESFFKAINMINVSLEQAKLNNMLQNPQRSMQDIAAIIKNCVDEIRPLFCSHSKKISYYAHPEKIMYECIPNVIHRMVMNILSNAFTHLKPDGKVEINLWECDDGIKLDISDDGAGIPQEKLPALFERFSPEASGIGLGLSLVQSYAHMHGGEVTVQSRNGRGTSFIIRLPRQKQNTTNAADAPIHKGEKTSRRFVSPVEWIKNEIRCLRSLL